MNGKIPIGIGYEECKSRELQAEYAREAEQIAAALDGERYDVRILCFPAAGRRLADAPPVELLYPVGAGARALGRLYAYAEAAGIAWAGPGLKSAVLGTDRILVKKLLAAERIPQSVFRSFARSQWEKNRMYYLIEMEMTLGYPCRIRPGEYSPYEVVAHNREELEQAVEAALQLRDRVLAEELVKGRLIAVASAVEAAGVNTGDLAIAGLSGWTQLAEEDKGKEQGDGVPEKSAADPPPSPGGQPLSAADPDLVEHIRGLAARTCAALDVRGPALLTFVTFDGHSRVLLAQADLCPGIGQGSLYAALWKRHGVDYPRLAARLVEHGLKRNRSPGNG